MKGMVLTALLVCAACAAPPPKDREVRLERLEADHRALIAQLDDLQARLLVDAERVRFWEDMRGRHESVSAIACTSQEAHAIAMAQYLERAPDAGSPARRPQAAAGPGGLGPAERRDDHTRAQALIPSTGDASFAPVSPPGRGYFPFAFRGGRS